MDIVNPNYLNYMEQIQKNRKDIENLYNQELSDITQLNFKENDVNGLQYANGKAIFQGKSTIIRDANSENLEVDSKVELKISSGDNDIVIDAGADNSTLEIHLDNETKNNISRALKTPLSTPIEDEFVVVGTDNVQKMIESSKIEKTENKITSSQYVDWRSYTLYPTLQYLANYCLGIDTFAQDGSFSNEDEMFTWILNTAPVGVYSKFFNIGGVIKSYIIMKASNAYGSVVELNYNDNIRYRRWTAGTLENYKTVQFI